MILLQPVIQIPIAAVDHFLAKRPADRARVRVVSVRGHTVRSVAYHRTGPAEEARGRHQIPRLAEQRIDQATVSINGDSAFVAKDDDTVVAYLFGFRRTSSGPWRHRSYRRPQRAGGAEAPRDGPPAA
jgi:hypothetical protein